MDVYLQLMDRLPELASLAESLRRAEQLLADCFTRGGKLLCCGNGGSASDCEHIVGELMKDFTQHRPLPEEWKTAFEKAGSPESTKLREGLQMALPAIALCSHTAFSSAWCNDAEPELVFAQQVFALGRCGDVLLAISTSGNSRNVLQAAYTARARGMTVISMTGESGGKLAAVSDLCLCVPAKDTARVQEYHLPLYHALCEGLEQRFFGSRHPAG